MKWIDRGLSCLLILGGIGHTFGVIGFYHDPETLFWALTDSVLLFLLAAVNLLRTWRPGDRALAIVTSCASAANLIITLGFARLIGSYADPRVILFAVLSLGLLGFSLRDALRREAA
jgi:phosphoglycerol transferase MdoB-like AlkP superfamily enzyme